MPFKNPHPLYGTWQAMKRRCYNPKNPQYKDYGGRGITVCPEWEHDFHTFASFMGERPKGMTLDRIDNDKGYSPDNCRWASRREQQMNRRIKLMVSIAGVEYRAIDLARKAGVKTDTIVERVKRGLPLEKVLSKDKMHNLSGLYLGAKASSKARKARTHCKRGHEYTPENTGMQKTGRFCKKCKAMMDVSRTSYLA